MKRKKWLSKLAPGDPVIAAEWGPPLGTEKATKRGYQGARKGKVLRVDCDIVTCVVEPNGAWVSFSITNNGRGEYNMDEYIYCPRCK